MHSVSNPGSGHDSGFILVMVLWAIVILSLMAAGYTASTRIEVRSAAGRIELAKAEALAEAGVNLALLELSRSRTDRGFSSRFAADGATTACAFDDGTGAESGAKLAVRIEDEAGKVDLNRASETLLESLLGGLGAGPEEATLYASRIVEYRGGNTGGNAAKTLKNAPFDLIDEIEQVMPADLAGRVRPYVTVHSNLAGVDRSKASPTVADVLAASPGVRSDERAFTIHALAQMASGVQHVAAVIVEFPEAGTAAFTLRQWRHGTAWSVPALDSSAGDDLPPC